MKTLEKQHKQLTILFGNIVMKAKTETELIAESLLNLEQKHEVFTAISVEVFPGVLQIEQKHRGRWREAIEAEMNIRHSETYRRPSGARHLVRSTLAPMCKSRHTSAFRSCGCEKYENDRGSSLLGAKMRKNSENVRKVLRVTV